MAKHDATTWKLPQGYEGFVGNSNIEIEVRTNTTKIGKRTVPGSKRNSELLGHLLISKGGLEWRPRSGKYERKMTWERFAQMMDDPSSLGRAR